MSPIDRPAAIRAALRELIAERGFHGTSMSAVAARAGVATGTAYVHYPSKDELVVAAYLEAKRELGVAAAAGVDPGTSPRERFVNLWQLARRHLEGDTITAAFLLQFESSPFAAEGHRRAAELPDDPIRAIAADPGFVAVLADLPEPVLYDLAFGPLLRAVATHALADEGRASPPSCGRRRGGPSRASPERRAARLRAGLHRPVRCHGGLATASRGKRAAITGFTEAVSRSG